MSFVAELARMPGTKLVGIQPVKKHAESTTNSNASQQKGWPVGDLADTIAAGFETDDANEPDLAAKVDHARQKQVQ